MHPRQVQFDTGGIFTRPPKATLWLMIATGVASILAMASAGRFGDGGLARLLLFSPSAVLDAWRVWTPFSYLFVGFDPLQLLFYVAFGLWMFAAQLERQWGTRRFLYYFFATGTGAALVTTLLGLFSPSLRLGMFDGTYVAFEAIVLGWVLMNWHASVLFFFFPVRAPWLLVIALVLPFLSIIQGLWVPFVPVLSGMGIGYLLLRRGLTPRTLLLKWRAWRVGRQMKQRRSSHLHVVPTEDEDREPRPPRYLN
jgi:membrane associated rhomboid family serine protease